MGVYIYEEILPERISPDEWKSVYKESLKLLAAYPFMDQEDKETDSGNYYTCAVHSRERRGFFHGYTGWRSMGDMKTGCNTEEYLLVDDINFYKDGCGADNGGDVITTLVDESRVPELKTVDRDSTACVFGGKTQGEDSHLYLLAVACLVADRFPNAAVVSGDINLGQCRAAVNWANQHLQHPISLPVQCDAERLLNRLKKIDGVDKIGGQLLDVFFSLTMENKDKKMGDVIRKCVPEEVIRDYFHMKFEKAKDDSLSWEVKEYLELGFDFTLLIRMLVTDPEGLKIEPDKFFDIIFGMQLHVEEKEAYDVTVGDKNNAKPDDIAMQFSRMFGLMGGAHNRNVGAFLPMKCIRDVCKMEMGDICDVDAEINAALERDEKNRSDEASDEARLQEMLYGGKGSEMDILMEARMKKDEEEKKYDVRSMDEIVYYKPGDTFVPELEDDLTDSFRTIRTFDTHFKKFKKMDRSEREQKLIEMDRSILISDSTWNRIFSHIMDDDYILRFYTVLSVDTSTQQVYNMVEKLLINPDVIDYFWQKTTGKKVEP